MLVVNHFATFINVLACTVLSVPSAFFICGQLFLFAGNSSKNWILAWSNPRAEKVWRTSTKLGWSSPWPWSWGNVTDKEFDCSFCAVLFLHVHLTCYGLCVQTVVFLKCRKARCLILASFCHCQHYKLLLKMYLFVWLRRIWCLKCAL